MRLVHWGDNPNEETLVYIPHTSCHLNLSVYNLSCLKIAEYGGHKYVYHYPYTEWDKCSPVTGKPGIFTVA